MQEVLSRNVDAAGSSCATLFVSDDFRVGDAAWRRRSDGVAPGAVASHRPVLLEHLDFRAVALVGRPVERGFPLRHPGVRIGAVFEQQADRVSAFRFRRHGIHERRSSVPGGAAALTSAPRSIHRATSAAGCQVAAASSSPSTGAAAFDIR